MAHTICFLQYYILKDHRRIQTQCYADLKYAERGLLRMSHLQINDASIYYEIKGTGHPLILISGFTCDHTIWTPIVNQLSKHFQVVLFDNRGVGKTKDSAKTLSAELLVEDLRALIHLLDLKKPHIIGQSMGGTVAQKFAATYPEEIGKLGLLVTTAKWRQAMLMALESYMNLRKKETPPDLLFDLMSPWIFGENFLKDTSQLALLKKLDLSDPNPQSIEDEARQFAILKNFDGRSDLTKIRAPTLIMYGKEDLFTLPTDAEFLASNICHAKLKEFNTGHGLILEAPEELAKSVISFF